LVLARSKFVDFFWVPKDGAKSWQFGKSIDFFWVPKDGAKSWQFGKSIQSTFGADFLVFSIGFGRSET